MCKLFSPLANDEEEILILPGACLAGLGMRDLTKTVTKKQALHSQNDVDLARLYTIMTASL